MSIPAEEWTSQSVTIHAQQSDLPGYKYCLQKLRHSVHPCTPSIACTCCTCSNHGAVIFPILFFSALFVLFVASFEADASEGLSFMHSVGIIHCDHKLVNTLICRADGPMGFVGKVTDPGVWCGESGFG